MSQTKITTDNINTLDAAMLTGSALPALNGAALTNIPGVTNSASDPLISTNPSAVGAAWLNTTTGNLFCCTDKTAGANVWINVGSGTGDIEPYVYKYYGTEFGYVAGGSSSTDVIGRFSLTSQSNATDVGDLTTGRGGTAGGKSATHGFVQGDGAAAGHSDEIEKFAYASSANASLHGDMTQAHNAPAEASMETHIYTMGGDGAQDNLIQKTATATDSNASNIGTLVNSIWYVGGSSSTTHGYAAGGFPSNNIIQKFSFSTDGNASDIADLVTSRRDTMGTSSATHGYSSGGYPTQNNIEKFTFASDANATDVGDMVSGDDLGTGVSAVDYSYLAGGRNNTNRIQRWSHSSDGNAVDWADLTVAQGFLPAGSAR